MWVKSYLWLIDLALDIDFFFIHWIGVHGCFTEARVLQNLKTKYIYKKKQVT